MVIDESLTNVFIEIQKKLKPELVLEVGAFNAEFSQIIVNQNICSNVHAYEASPYVYERYKDKLIGAGIEYKNLAISNEKGTVSFEIQLEHKDPSLVGNNTILRRAEEKSYSYIQIPCNTLDNLYPNPSNICLWMDVEGANREVLLGSPRLLANVQSIFIETEHRQFWKNQWLHMDVVRYLDEHGFIMVYMQKQYDDQTNCIFVRKELLGSI